MLGYFKTARRNSKKPDLLAALQLVTDVELLRPLLLRTREQCGHVFEPVACFTDELLAKVPDLRQAFESDGIRVVSVRADAMIRGSAPSLDRVAAVISATDTTARPHRAVHELVLRANRRAIPTFTLQHGFENIGLTYFDEAFPASFVRFASSRIFVWGPIPALSPEVPGETRDKCVSVGRPTKRPKVGVVRTELPRRPCNIAVFENLHWTRYGDEYRRRFIADLQSLAAQHPQVMFWVKPHPAGLWMTSRYSGPLPSAENIVLLHHGNPRCSGLTGDDLIRDADAVITTPSTTAIDAAQMDRAVAVIGYDLDLPMYAGLFQIRASEDWNEFIRGLNQEASRRELAEQSRRFVDRVLVRGDATDRMLEYIRTADAVAA